MKITVQKDKKCKGTSTRFTIGKAGGDISGAIYVKEGVNVPDELVLRFKEKEEEDARL
jgi:hypothetical protein